jgi:hypothetical protein
MGSRPSVTDHRHRPIVDLVRQIHAEALTCLPIMLKARTEPTLEQMRRDEGRFGPSAARIACSRLVGRTCAGGDLWRGKHLSGGIPCRAWAGCPPQRRNETPGSVVNPVRAREGREPQVRQRGEFAGRSHRGPGEVSRVVPIV